MNKEICEKCDLWRMAAELCVEDEAFFYMDDSEPKLALMMNDIFYYAAADAEEVEWNELRSIYIIWKQQGWKGLVKWVSVKRGLPPLPEIQKQIVE